LKRSGIAQLVMYGVGLASIGAVAAGLRVADTKALGATGCGSYCNGTKCDLNENDQSHQCNTNIWSASCETGDCNC
jgi:hypothetical protein